MSYVCSINESIAKEQKPVPSHLTDCTQCIVDGMTEQGNLEPAVYNYFISLQKKINVIRSSLFLVAQQSNRKKKTITIRLHACTSYQRIFHLFCFQACILNKMVEDKKT